MHSSPMLWHLKGVESWDVRRVNIYVEAHCLWLQSPGPALLSERYLQWLTLCGPCACSSATTEWTLDPETDGFSSPTAFLYYATHICCWGSRQGVKLALCLHSLWGCDYRWNSPDAEVFCLVLSFQFSFVPSLRKVFYVKLCFFSYRTFR